MFNNAKISASVSSSFKHSHRDKSKYKMINTIVNDLPEIADLKQ